MDPGRSAPTTVISKVLGVPGTFRKPSTRDGSDSSAIESLRNRKPRHDPDLQQKHDRVLDELKKKAPDRYWDNMESTGDKQRDHEKLKNRWNEYVDENPDNWSKNQRRPCISAVWDRESGRVYYDHNVANKQKWNMDPENLHPTMRERYDRLMGADGNPRDSHLWELDEDQRRHGAPGTHSESRATNRALQDARAEGRDARMEDFMLHNGNPISKESMRCCGTCTQMCDGVHGAKAGWQAGGPGGFQRDENWDGDFSV